MPSKEKLKLVNYSFTVLFIKILIHVIPTFYCILHKDFTLCYNNVLLYVISRYYCISTVCYIKILLYSQVKPGSWCRNSYSVQRVFHCMLYQGFTVCCIKILLYSQVSERLQCPESYCVL